MRNIIYITGALGVLTVLYALGMLRSYNIAHPFWLKNAAFYGGIGGVGFAYALFIVRAVKPTAGRILTMITGLFFVASLSATRHYAQIFIDAANFDKTAADIWHWGSYLTIGTFVIVVAHGINAMLSKR